MFVLCGLSSFVYIQRELGAGTSLVRPVISQHQVPRQVSSFSKQDIWRRRRRKVLFVEKLVDGGVLHVVNLKEIVTNWLMKIRKASKQRTSSRLENKA